MILESPRFSSSISSGPEASQNHQFLRIPLGEYCQLHIEATAADWDAAGLPTDVDLLGRSLVIRGTWVLGSNQPRPFEVDIADTGEMILDFEALALTKGMNSAVMTTTLEVSRWFDQVQMEASRRRGIERHAQSRNPRELGRHNHSHCLNPTGKLCKVGAMRSTDSMFDVIYSTDPALQKRMLDAVRRCPLLQLWSLSIEARQNAGTSSCCRTSMTT